MTMAIASLTAHQQPAVTIILLYVIPSHWCDGIGFACAGSMWTGCLDENNSEGWQRAIGLSRLVPAHVACEILVRRGRRGRVVRRERRRVRYDVAIFTRRHWLGGKRLPRRDLVAEPVRDSADLSVSHISEERARARGST